jgi:membrane protein insertase Oxa1/YidC/SpoIIIJ
MQEFFENASRYPRYFITVTLGIFFFLFEKLRPLLKNPVSAVALITFVIASFMFVTFTLRAMLGLSPV